MKKLTPDFILINIYSGLFWGALFSAIALFFLVGLDIIGAISLNMDSLKEILLSERGSISLVFLFVGGLGFIYSLICGIILIFIKFKN